LITKELSIDAKTFVFLGKKGCGKSTMINTWANYHFDVGLEENFRIRLANEGEFLD